MKIYKLVIALMVLISGCSSSMTSQTRKEKKELTRLMIKEKIESENFKIDINRAMPLGGRSVNLTSPYSITINNDSVDSRLPYFGRAYNVPYGGGNGLQFKAPLTSCVVEVNNRGTGIIKAVAKNDEDTYTFTITVQPNGNTYVTVSMQNRQTINYDGQLDLGYEEVTTSALPTGLLPDDLRMAKRPLAATPKD